MEILYNGRPLAADYKLSDVAYIFSWKEVCVEFLSDRKIQGLNIYIYLCVCIKYVTYPNDDYQREPLRLWYRIHPSIIKEEEIKITTADQTRRKTNPRATLVDITTKRQWNGKKEERCKRRKRSSAKIQRDPSPDRPVKTIFDDESHAAEFSCSTPIPSAVSTQDGEPSNKKQNWLPKAVFDLDDRALFAQRLQRITNAPDVPESVVKEEHLECDPVEQKADNPLTPLRICVSPEPTGADQPDDPVHDSIGALDLSGTSHKGDSSTDVSSPLSSGSCRSNGASPVSGGPVSASKVGPHPYFMTPSAVYHHVQQQDPAQSMAALTAVAAAAQSAPPESKATTTPSKVPIWDILRHIRPVEGKSIKKSNSLLSLLKSNPILFRPNHNNNNTMKNKTNKQSTTSPHSA